MDTTTFFSTLFAEYPSAQEFRLEIRCLAPQWTSEEDFPKPWPRQWYITDSTQILNNAAIFCDGHAARWDVYFGVLPRSQRSGRQDDVHAAICLFADIDGGTEGVEGAIARLFTAPVPLPHVVIRSGSGIHCYWLLDAPEPLPDHTSRERFKRILRCLAKAVGGESPAAHSDYSACEVARVLRVPGTFNHKITDNPRPVEVLRVNSGSPRLSLDSWVCLLPKEPVQKWVSAPRESRTPAGFISDGLWAWAAKGYPEGNRHHELTGAAAWLVRDCGLNKQDALTLLEKKANASGGRRSITQKEIEAMVKWA